MAIPAEINPAAASDECSINEKNSKNAGSVSVAEANTGQTQPISASWWRRILSFVWDSVDGDPECRQYVHRLDLFLFPTVCLGYFIKYLDQTNYSNAFVSGMQEELSLYGNERNWLNTWFNLGIMVGSVPAQTTQLNVVRSSILIPCCELIWSALVIGMGFAKNIKTVGAYDRCSQHVQQLLAARHLVALPLKATVNLFNDQPLALESVIRSLMVRLRAVGQSHDLAENLMSGSGTNAQRGAVLVADLVDEPRLQERVLGHVLDVVQQGALSTIEREYAGRILSRLGDPRDLQALAKVPSGTFVFGSNGHPNSQPPEELTLGGFRIGLYPVVSRDYSAFVRETGRNWVSPDGVMPERHNAPATDLTWHDAVAYCSWLTDRWRASESIGADEHVRLPTEPEWERASRGDQNTAGNDGLVYPWGVEWRDDAANCEETGLNRTYSVGLFPKGRSPYGCYDMARQAWEWCTTLWGEDMATPSFQYPWLDDGREALVASSAVRRLLRGGCFSSRRPKACCTYRGSLEPAGFWRGNGFRIVPSCGSSKIMTVFIT